MWKIPARAVMTAAMALTFLLSLTSHEVFADQTIKLPPGTKVQIHGNSATINNGGGGNGLKGDYSCFCTKSGSCQLTQYPNAMFCGTLGGGDACLGSCVMSTTSGIAAPAAAKPKARAQ